MEYLPTNLPLKKSTKGRYIYTIHGSYGLRAYDLGIFKLPITKGEETPTPKPPFFKNP